MNGRVSFAMLVIAVLAFACTRSGTGANLAAAKQPHHKKGAAVASSLKVIHTGDDVRFALNVINDGDKKVELDFSNGQTHDIEVLDASGKRVWRWAEGRMFTSAYQNRVLRTDDTLSFRESWTPPSAGTYTAVVRLVSRNYPQEQRAEFVVP